MADVFEIKYLFELYPDVDFTEEFVSSQEVTYLDTDYNSQATGRAFSHIFDSGHEQRPIQTLGKDKYQVKLELARNIDINRLNIAYTTLTPTVGDSFVIYNVAVTSEKKVGLLYMYTIEFFKSSTRYINHLSSDNALAYKTGLSDRVNELSYTVDNPSYVFNNVVTYRDTSIMMFKVALNDLTDTIEVGDDYYLHSNNLVFNEAVDDSGDYMNFATCSSKDASFVYFVCSADTVASSKIYTINNLEINNEASYPDIPSGVTVAAKSISFIIYTFINPIYSNLLTPVDGTNLETGVSENQKYNAKDTAYFKVWVTKDELYKIEYLNYALFDDVIFTLSDDTVVAPIQVKDIATAVENDNLIDLYEYDITMLYNNKMVNIYR